jgi:hypothetical protein
MLMSVDERRVGGGSWGEERRRRGRRLKLEVAALEL